MKIRIIIGIMVVSLILFTTATQGLAGAKQRHRWEGVGIALGSIAALGIVSNLIAPPRPPVIIHPPRWHYPPPPPPMRWMPGHWQIHRVREPETWRRVWVPSHYDNVGNWIEGHWKHIRSGGRLVERRVWVPGHYQ